uniref:UDP-xylose and UDP-N-acetylglucosamine transporter n=1 Tax=Timema cristinae TaxID=61476 RepID=A0A7R9GZU1_TIMCR|nr:unnamed protein product [Timema cristinae]
MCPLAEVGSLTTEKMESRERRRLVMAEPIDGNQYYKLHQVCSSSNFKYRDCGILKWHSMVLFSSVMKLDVNFLNILSFHSYVGVLYSPDSKQFKEKTYSRFEYSKDDPGSGNLITFSQFLFIALEGFIFTSKFGTQKPRIGLWDYGILVAMFFIANLCNNYAFNFNIPMPLHMIFRAGSLIANMIMGIVILRKKYAFSKYLSVFMISAGIVICTFVSGQDVVRILLLTVALFVSARMGIYQEVLYAKYGKHPREALFYTHLLPLPGFLIWYQSIVEHAGFLAQSEPFAIPILGFGLPKIYICINSVYVLTTECSSLTVTLVVTLRKFVSLLFSIIYFKNDFTLLHWTGTLLVFVGTLIFTEIVSKIINSIRESSKFYKQNITKESLEK